MTLTEKEYQARVRWHCRRGMLELDVLLLNFFDQHYAGMNQNERTHFEKLLDETDQNLFSWLVKREAPPDIALGEMVARILSSHNAKG